MILTQRFVALRKESVDRNENAKPTKQAKGVALRKESVDRNYSFGISGVDKVSSLSARRAWIEILWGSDSLSSKYGRSPQGERG